MRLDQSVVRPFVAETMRALWLVIAVLMFAACCAPHVFASPLEVRYRHPGGAIGYDGVEVCESAGCTRYARACAAGATCAATADLASGDHPEVWLVATSGALRSDPSNRRAVTVAAPSGCAWDLNADGAVGGMDFAAFVARYARGTANGVDFAAFREAFGAACPRQP